MYHFKATLFFDLVQVPIIHLFWAPDFLLAWRASF
jgi:hypothetical protein